VRGGGCWRPLSSPEILPAVTGRRGQGAGTRSCTHASTLTVDAASSQPQPGGLPFGPPTHHTVMMTLPRVASLEAERGGGVASFPDPPSCLTPPPASLLLYGSSLEIPLVPDGAHADAPVELKRARCVLRMDMQLGHSAPSPAKREEGVPQERRRDSTMTPRQPHEDAVDTAARQSAADTGTRCRGLLSHTALQDACRRSRTLRRQATLI
jgi:hypothetical protein